MSQVKKPAVREAIVSAALELFQSKGYARTTLAQIAARAGTTTSNIYVYFRSKLEVFMSVYEPWLDAEMTALEAEVLAICEPRLRLRHLLVGLWQTIPNAGNGFPNNFMQALATGGLDEGYSPNLLLRTQARVSRLIRASLPAERAHLADNEMLAHIILMAHDGFAMHCKLGGPRLAPAALADLVADLVLDAAALARAEQ